MSIHAHPPGRRALAVSAAAGALAATLDLTTDQASAAYTAQVQAGTLHITGDAASDTLALQLGAPGTLQVSVNGVPAFSFDATTFTADPDARVALCRRALDVAEGTPALLESVRARLELGSTLRYIGRRVEARDALRPALAQADAVGAVLLADSSSSTRTSATTWPAPRRITTKSLAAQWSGAPAALIANAGSDRAVQSSARTRSSASSIWSAVTALNAPRLPQAMPRTGALRAAAARSAARTVPSPPRATTRSPSCSVPVVASSRS